MPRKTIELEFPAAGVVRRLGLRAGADRRGPYPAPWATNVRLEDDLTSRLRGGSYGISETPYAELLYVDDSNTRDELVFEDDSGTTTRFIVAASAAEDFEDPVYRGRALEVHSNAIWASRAGNESDFDWDKDATDVLRPALWQLQLAGQLGAGDDVVALAPCEDKNLLCFTATQTWVLRGDPITGSLYRVSKEVGAIAWRAWCRNHGTVYFLSSHGLYSVSVDGSGLKSLSREKIPEDLLGVSDDACTLIYIHGDDGVFIHKSSGVSWFYDVVRDQFWPYSYDTDDSHVLFGPFRLGAANRYGRVLRLHGITATGSADVTWRLVIGDTAESAAANGKTAIEAAIAGTSYSSYVASSGTWSAGRNHVSYPRNRAVWCVLWLSSTGTWAYEGAAMDLMVSGQWR